jgi:hypothetical protein
VVVFGAGPIGLGATIAFKSVGVSHVVVADLIPARLEKALAVGADAVINSDEEDVADRLLELHGAGESLFPGKVATDIYFDAAGAPAVIDRAGGRQARRTARGRRGAQTAGRSGLRQHHEQRDHHRRIDGLPRRNLRSHQRPHHQLGKIRGDRQPHDPLRRRLEALKTASTPGAADKVFVTFN